jgi:hypothetical protein
VEEYDDDMETFSSTPPPPTTSPAGTETTPEDSATTQPTATPADQQPSTSATGGEDTISPDVQTASMNEQQDVQMVEMQTPNVADDDVIFVSGPTPPQPRQTVFNPPPQRPAVPEYVPLHRPPAVLESTIYLTQEQVNSKC